MKNKSTLSENSADADPIKQFEKWYRERLKTKLAYPDAVTLATSAADGHVSARTVLLKDFSDEGFVIFTDYNSKKGQQLSQNPKAALLFYWPESERQVRIEGFVEKLSEEESDEYFKSRPRDSQTGAWASEQSKVIPGRGYLETRVIHYTAEFSDKPVPRPSHWGGFRLVPEWIEFWQEGEFRLHDRIAYKRTGKRWRLERLSP
jgi:pyridoxamine 5'-phosphate oxidase